MSIAEAIKWKLSLSEDSPTVVEGRLNLEPLAPEFAAELAVWPDRTGPALLSLAVFAVEFALRVAIWWVETLRWRMRYECLLGRSKKMPSAEMKDIFCTVSWEIQNTEYKIQDHASTPNMMSSYKQIEQQFETHRHSNIRVVRYQYYNREFSTFFSRSFFFWMAFASSANFACLAFSKAGYGLFNFNWWGSEREKR